MTEGTEGMVGAGDEAGRDPSLPACYTPQQVRFTDRRGVLWTVRCAHRLSEAELVGETLGAPGTVGTPPPDGGTTPPGALPILVDEEGMRIAACRAGRCWLEFSSASERRRLRMVPPRWYLLSTASLALLCEEAEVA